MSEPPIRVVFAAKRAAYLVLRVYIVSVALIFALCFAYLAPLLISAMPIGDEPGVGAGTEAGAITIGTFNVHYVGRDKGRLEWDRRKDAVAAVIEEQMPDIMAFQEMETFEGGHFNDKNIQLEFLRHGFTGYSFTAVGDPREYPFTQPIMYRSNRFSEIEQGFFFFSETPDQIYSRSWDGRFPAFCSWARLHDRVRNRTFYVYNVHLDSGSRINRNKAAVLIVDRITNREYPDEPVIVTGDFNAPAYFPPVRKFADAGLKVARTRGSTVHFNLGINVVPAIDHVLYSDRFSHLQTRVVRKRFDRVWPSDHYPVFVTLE